MAYIGNPAAPTLAQVSDNTITSAKIVDGAVTPSDLSTGHPTWNASGDVGIGTTSPGTNLQINSATGGAIRLQYIGNSGYGQLETNANNELIFKTSGANERMRIDSAGRVTMPYQPFFYADRDASWTGWVPNNQTQPMLYNRATVNTGGHYNTATGLFTAPVTGVYQFWAGIYGDGTFTFEQIWAIVNGVRGPSFVVGVNTTNRTGTCFFKLSAGDTFGVHGYSGASSATMTATSYHTFFSGHLVS